MESLKNPEKKTKFQSNIENNIIENTKHINNKNDDNKIDENILKVFNEKDKYIKTKQLKKSSKKERNRGDIHIVKMN